MSRNKILFVFGVFVVLLATLLWWFNPPLTRHRLPQFPSEPSRAAPTHVQQANQALPNEYPQLSLSGVSKKDAIREFNRYTKRDSRYEWKIPIHFYGKVADQYGDPVVGASVHLQWINLDGERGVGEIHLVTNAHGFFSLEGVKGKRLLVLRMERDGYYDADLNDNQTSFEFANPAEPTFYEPNADRPVAFLMRKKGESQPLVVKSVELKLIGQGATGTVDLPTGKVSPSDGQLQVTVWKPTITTEQINARKVYPYDWRIQIKIKDGALAKHKDASAFEAPESGYSAEYSAQLHPTGGASADVTADKQFYFYFGQPRKYGRLHLRTDGDRPYVSIDYWFNPSGSRSLEYDSKRSP